MKQAKIQKNINNPEIIQRTIDFVKDKLIGDSSGHDWWHVYRVWKTSIKIGKKEQKANMFIVQLAALLHDIADWKFQGGNILKGPEIASKFLKKLQVEKKVIDHVCSIIEKLSFKGAKVENKTLTLEGQIVQDADRLDAIGAIGIARTFAYGGYKRRTIYNPSIKPVLHNTFEEYKNNCSPTINHFYEKLLLLKARMNTYTAKQLAVEKQIFMEEFLKQFFKEIE